MRKYLLIIALGLVSVTASAQRIALKTNIISDATATPSLALEFGLGKKTSFDIYGGYNPFVYNGGLKMDWEGEGKMFKHWMIQPEFRYWTCEAFNGFFIGLHAMGGQHNVAGIDIPPLQFGGNAGLSKDERHEGWFAGGGASVGYQLILGTRWNLEFSLGAGYIYMKSDVYDLADKCTLLREQEAFNMIWITKATVSLVFFFK